MTEELRHQQLIKAGNNPLRLPGSEVQFDLFSDVPQRVLVPEPARTSDDIRPEDICEAAKPLTGAAKLAIATKGRGAENALVDALEVGASPVVLTHPLFSTTQAALTRRGAVLEALRIASEGSSDVDIDALRERLARG